MQELRQKFKGDKMPQLMVSFCKLAFKPQRTMDQVISQFDFEKAIRTIVDPNTKLASRYNRNWRFSQPETREGFLTGQFGFVTVETAQQGDYDEELQKFVSKPLDSKQPIYSLWAIDLESQILGFEIKDPYIKYQSFVGNFQDFLNARRDISLAIEKVFEKSKFIEWAGNVDRVTKFTAILRPPNPTYSKNPDDLARKLLQEPNADQAKVEFTKQKGSSDSLNTEEGKTIQNLVEYGSVGYSTVVARGLKNNKLKLFDSRKRIPIETEDVPKGLDDNSKLVRIMNLIRKFLNE